LWYNICNYHQPSRVITHGPAQQDPDSLTKPPQSWQPSQGKTRKSTLTVPWRQGFNGEKWWLL
jgi:hypothetical protein